MFCPNGNDKDYIILYFWAIMLKFFLVSLIFHCFYCLLFNSEVTSDRILNDLKRAMAYLTSIAKIQLQLYNMGYTYKLTTKGNVFSNFLLQE